MQKTCSSISNNKTRMMAMSHCLRIYTCKMDIKLLTMKEVSHKTANARSNQPFPILLQLFHLLPLLFRNCFIGNSLLPIVAPFNPKRGPFLGKLVVKVRQLLPSIDLNLPHFIVYLGLRR
ncbi:hypothetical protein HanIR_Chr16g0826071 [Helianthus annuus]|nr:hypothetical protein HanIR_Chr16g0826071 [Helianthus annuus]